jgi:hypothetical protein
MSGASSSSRLYAPPFHHTRSSGSWHSTKHGLSVETGKAGHRGPQGPRGLSNATSSHDARRLQVVLAASVFEILFALVSAGKLLYAVDRHEHDGAAASWAWYRNPAHQYVWADMALTVASAWFAGRHSDMLRRPWHHTAESEALHRLQWSPPRARLAFAGTWLVLCWGLFLWPDRWHRWDAWLAMVYVSTGVVCLVPAVASARYRQDLHDRVMEPLPKTTIHVALEMDPDLYDRLTSAPGRHLPATHALGSFLSGSIPLSFPISGDGGGPGQWLIDAGSTLLAQGMMVRQSGGYRSLFSI